MRSVRVLTWPPAKNDKSGFNFALGISSEKLAPEVLALGGSNLPSGSVIPFTAVLRRSGRRYAACHILEYILVHVCI